MAAELCRLVSSSQWWSRVPCRFLCHRQLRIRGLSGCEMRHRDDRFDAVCLELLSNRLRLHRLESQPVHAGVNLEPHLLWLFSECVTPVQLICPVQGGPNIEVHAEREIRRTVRALEYQYRLGYPASRSVTASSISATANASTVPRYGSRPAPRRARTRRL